MLVDIHTNLFWYPDHLSEEFVESSWAAKRAKMRLTGDVHCRGIRMKQAMISGDFVHLHYDKPAGTFAQPACRLSLLTRHIFGAKPAFGVLGWIDDQVDCHPEGAGIGKEKYR